MENKEGKETILANKTKEKDNNSNKEELRNISEAILVII